MAWASPSASPVYDIFRPSSPEDGKINLDVEVQRTCYLRSISGVMSVAPFDESSAEHSASELERLRKTVAELQAREAQYRREIGQLQESEDLFRSVYRESPISIELLDAGGRIVDVNKACLDMFGMRETVDRNWPALFDDPIVPDDVKNALLKNETVRYEVSMDFDDLRTHGLYKGTRRGIASFDVLICPLGARVGSSLTGYLVEMQEVTGLKRAQQQLRTYQEQLRSLASQLSVAEERERRRLAADLHDQVGQALAVIKLKLGPLRQSIGNSETKSYLDEIRDLLEKAISQTRSLTFDLSPPMLYELGLEPALEWLAEEFQAKHGISTQLQDDGRAKPLDDDIRGLLFRAANELLINVAKHARAREVLLSVKRVNENICIQVKDDGVGFDSEDSTRPAHGFGLFNIRERLTAIGGHIEIKSKPGWGTAVILVAPLSGDKSASEKTN